MSAPWGVRFRLPWSLSQPLGFRGTQEIFALNERSRLLADLLWSSPGVTPSTYVRGPRSWGVGGWKSPAMERPHLRRMHWGLGEDIPTSEAEDTCR